MKNIFGSNWRSSISGIAAIIFGCISFGIIDNNNFNISNNIIFIFKLISIFNAIIFVLTVKDSNVTGGNIPQTKEAEKRTKKQPEAKEIYTTKIEAPTYEPKNQKPNLAELIDTSKSDELIIEIINTDLPKDEKKFLIEAAKRHTIFNYEKIADYYAHSSEKIQYLMEKSALVIIDFKKAIENGYVNLCETIKNKYLEHTN